MSLFTTPHWRPGPEPLPLLRRAPRYLYLAPHPHLTPAVAHYTLTFSEGVAPEGARWLDLLPDAGGCFIFTAVAGTLTGRVWGPTTRMVRVEKDFEEVPLRLFVELRPGGLHRLTGLDMEALRDGDFSLEEVFPSLWRALRPKLEGADRVAELVAAVDELLLRLQEGAPAFAPAVARGMEFLLQRDGAVEVETLCREEHYSARQLSRLFERHLGLGAKTFGRLVRINRAAALLAGSGENLTRLGAGLGYHDQAHFIRDFREICGVTPGQYRQNLSDFYKEPLKF